MILIFTTEYLVAPISIGNPLILFFLTSFESDLCTILRFNNCNKRVSVKIIILYYLL